jgi:hypothetical protein
MKDQARLPNKEGDDSQVDKGKGVSNSIHMAKQTKPTVIAEEPESSKQAEIRGASSKVSYCFQCKTKGHAIEVCHASMYYDICATHDHVRLRCRKF